MNDCTHKWTEWYPHPHYTPGAVQIRSCEGCGIIEQRFHPPVKDPDRSRAWGRDVEEYGSSDL